MSDSPDDDAEVKAFMAGLGQPPAPASVPDESESEIVTLRQQLAERDQRIAEMEAGLLDLGAPLREVEGMRTQIVAHEDTIAELNRALADQAVARRESEARLVEGNADTMRAAGVSDTHDDTFGTAIGAEVIGPDVLTALQERASLDGLTVADEILALLAK